MAQTAEGDLMQRNVIAAALTSAVLMAGCGASSSSPTASPAASPSPATTIASSATSSDSGASATSSDSGASAAQLQHDALSFATCMRANGVPNFPDPAPGGEATFTVPGGTNPAAPAFQAARAKCQKLLTGDGPPGPGSTTHPSAQTVAKLVKIAQCMRRHGISEFPDPVTTVPSNPTGIREISDFDGAILLFPATLNVQSPAYRQDLAACGAPPLGLRH
jgi:hypothetical protein